MNTLSPKYLLVLLTALASSMCAQPKLSVVEGTKLDLGTINRGTVVEKKVSLKNVGTDTLIIGKVDVSCGCTGTVVSSTHIGPGQTGTLLITFNSKNFVGGVHKSVSVNSNAKDSPSTIIEFTANIIEEVSVSPTTIWFKDAVSGQTAIVTLKVKNAGKEKLTLTAFSSPLADFSLKLPSQPIEPGETVEVVAEYKPKSAQQLINNSVVLKTSNKSQPEVSIPIYGNVKEFKFQ
jgi:hypothetical protein